MSVRLEPHWSYIIFILNLLLPVRSSRPGEARTIEIKHDIHQEL